MMTQVTQKSKIHTLVKVAVLAAIASIVMLFEFPLPFAPGFYELDLSETVILMGGFAMGPLAAATIELIKNLVNLILNGTSTAYIGELSNFVIGCSFVVPASLLYKYHKSVKGALLSLVTGVLCLTVAGSLLNYFVLIPVYVQMYGMPLDSIISAGSAVNPLVSDLKTLIVFAVAPFNLVKGVTCSALNFVLYKRLSRVLHI